MSDHHDHPLPPPEPDNVQAGGVTFWGLISFISVLVVVFGLSGYFWLEREDADARLNDKYGKSAYRVAMEEEAKAKLGNINEAMKAITDGSGTNARGMHFDMPKAVAAPAPAAPAVKPEPFKVDKKLAAKGKALFTSKTCSACHSINGTRLVGPTMKGIWARKEKMADGTELYVDRAYFTRSIKEPMAQIVEGYPPAMAALPVSDEEIEALLHYVASIK
jgi:cytochrome c551/c552